MILLMGFSAGGKRGGEVYNYHIFKFIKSNFKDVQPNKLMEIPSELRNPFKHLLYNLANVREKLPDMIIIDVSSGLRNTLAVWWMKRKKRKVLLVVQEQRLNYRYDIKLVKWFVNQFEKYLIKNADILVVNSEYSARLAKQKKARHDVPIIIAHPGLENYRHDVEQSAFQTRDDADQINLLFVGACKQSKGIIHLVRAIDILNNKNIKLDLVGGYSTESPYYKQIKKYIDERKLNEKVIFHGFVDKEKLFGLYNQTTIYVHPSLMEGYGMTLAEAICYGLPIVTTTAGAIPELVSNGVNAILVEPSNSEELALAIKRLIDDKELRQKMRIANLEKAKTLPTWDNFHEVLEDKLAPLIEKILR